MECNYCNAKMEEIINLGSIVELQLEDNIVEILVKNNIL